MHLIIFICLTIIILDIIHRFVSNLKHKRFADWIFCEVVGLKRGPLSPVNTIEELLGEKKVAAPV
jgi:hypothetical protein